MKTKANRKSKKFRFIVQNPAQNQSKGQLVIYHVYKTIRQFFPDLIKRLGELPDIRERKEYKIAELLTGAVAMFLFKEGSRNAMNNDRKESKFSKNYTRLFKLKLPHMDTVNELLLVLNEHELEGIKAALVTGLINQKVLRKFKFLGKSYIIAIDGTGIASFDYRHCDACLTKTSKNGNITYFHNVLEAKLVTSNGLSLSLATEWIANEEKSEYEKQDCELKAFRRLAVKIKKYFPALPILIAADGLYPNQTFFEICKNNGWHFVATFQDNSLKSIQEEIVWFKNKPDGKTSIYRTEKHIRVTLTYTYLNDIQYKNYNLSWVECIENRVNSKTGETEQKRFVHLTDIRLDIDTAVEISYAGRMRWNIENEGFNTQKNYGYNLEHKYSRISFLAMKNYYQCLQIAHTINQLVLKSQCINNLFDSDGKFTINKLWQRLMSFIIECDISENELLVIDTTRFQIRLIT